MYRTCYGVQIIVCISTYSDVTYEYIILSYEILPLFLGFWLNPRKYPLPITGYVKSSRLICDQNMHVKLLELEYCFWRCDAVWCSGRLPTIRRNIQSPFQGRWVSVLCHHVVWYLSTEVNWGRLCLHLTLNMEAGHRYSEEFLPSPRLHIVTTHRATLWIFIT
jgi:hypothetical protein